MKRSVIYLLLGLSATAKAQYKGGANDGASGSVVAAQNPAGNIYRGGDNDGYHVQLITGQNKQPNIYAGGGNDGFQSNIIFNQNTAGNIYKGGSNDGFHQSIALLQNPTNNIYAGGNNDGFHSNIIINQNTAPNIYQGSNGDGYSLSVSKNQNVQFNIYNGGVSDGFATIQVLNQNRLNPLPVKLIEFNGHWQQEDIALFWRTASEINAHHFELERSIGNANNFVKIATIAASGNSTTEKRYDYTDRDLQPGQMIFYRLKPVDKDGKFVYSAIIRFTREAKQVVHSIYPNPGKGLFNISISGVNNFRDYSYRVVNASGQLVAQGAINGANTQFDITRLSAGTYYVQVLNAGKHENTYTIILQH